MNYLIIDTETTCLKLATGINGYALIKQNFLCTVGLLDSEDRMIIVDYTDGDPEKPKRDLIQHIINNADLLVFFNGKFDMHWLSRYGISYMHKKILDLQIAFSIMNSQQTYPSLNSCCSHYDLDKKLDIVKEQYWDCGIDTDQVPKDILHEYLANDLRITKDLYKVIVADITPEQERLIAMTSYDAAVLCEIEKNGLLYDYNQSKVLAADLLIEIDDVKKQIQRYVNFEHFNPSSGDHLSVVLYGGTISVDNRIRNGEYKSGQKEGKPRYRIEVITKEYKGMFPQLEKAALKKKGYFKTDYDTLVQLKGNKSENNFVKLILDLAEKEKMYGTYLNGLPLMIDKYSWGSMNGCRMVHGQFNQVSAVTGRLSSTKPNQQNIDKSICYLFVSRYK